VSTRGQRWRVHIGAERAATAPASSISRSLPGHDLKPQEPKERSQFARPRPQCPQNSNRSRSCPTTTSSPRTQTKIAVCQATTPMPPEHKQKLRPPRPGPRAPRTQTMIAVCRTQIEVAAYQYIYIQPRSSGSSCHEVSGKVQFSIHQISRGGQLLSLYKIKGVCPKPLNSAYGHSNPVLWKRLSRVVLLLPRGSIVVRPYCGELALREQAWRAHGSTTGLCICYVVYARRRILIRLPSYHHHLCTYQAKCSLAVLLLLPGSPAA
jgi:hypothetical protein